jgi:hypothetical protein
VKGFTRQERIVNQGIRQDLEINAVAYTKNTNRTTSSFKYNGNWAIIKTNTKLQTKRRKR